MTFHVNAREVQLVPQLPGPREAIAALHRNRIYSGTLHRLALLIVDHGLASADSFAWETTGKEVAEIAGVEPRTFRNWVKAAREHESNIIEVQASNCGTTLVLHLSDRKSIGKEALSDRKPLGNGEETDRKPLGNGTTPATCGHDPYSESSSKEEDDVYKPIDTSRDEEKRSSVQAASSSDEKIRRRCEKASTRVLSHSLEGIEDTATLADIEGEVLTLLGLCYSHVSLEHASAYTSRLAGKNITGAEAMRYLQERLAEMMTRKDIDSIPKSPASAIRLMTKAEDIARFKSTLVRTGEIQVREAQGESEGWGAEGLAALEDFKRSFLEDGEVS